MIVWAGAGLNDLDSIYRADCLWLFPLLFVDPRLEYVAVSGGDLLLPHLWLGDRYGILLFALSRRQLGQSGHLHHADHFRS